MKNSQDQLADISNEDYTDERERFARTADRPGVKQGNPLHYLIEVVAPHAQLSPDDYEAVRSGANEFYQGSAIETFFRKWWILILVIGLLTPVLKRYFSDWYVGLITTDEEQDMDEKRTLVELLAKHLNVS